MKALHRLVGNTPKRGFGVGLFSPGFPGGFRILAKTDIRLPMTNVPGEKSGSPMGGPVEGYRAFELQPLRYGLVAAFQSIKVNIDGSRPSSYTDTVVPVGDEVQQNVTAGPGIEAILRFRGFISMDEFLGLEKNTLDVTDWACEGKEVLSSYTAPLSFTEKAHRALLQLYWRAATAQCFGPWNPRTKRYAYESHPLMHSFVPRFYTVSVCLGPEDACGRLIERAKGFMWKYILTALPGAVANMASMSAPVPVRSIYTVYDSTALAIVYPEQEKDICFDFRTGAAPEITPDEDDFMRLMLSGAKPAAVQDIYQRFCSENGTAAESDLPFLWDYDVLYQLYCLEKDGLSLRERMKCWFALHAYMKDRHGFTDQQLALLLEAVDSEMARRLSAGQAEALEALQKQDDEWENRATGELLTFLWQKTLDGQPMICAQTKPLLAAYYVPEADHSFSESLLKMSLATEQEEQRAADLTADILDADFLSARPLQASHVNVLSDQAFVDLCGQHPLVGNTVRGYLEKESRMNPKNMLHMLPITVRFLDRGALMERLFTYLAGEKPVYQLADKDCVPVAEGLRGRGSETPAVQAYAGYMTAALMDHPGDLDWFLSAAQGTKADMTDAMLSILSQFEAREILMTPEQETRLLGAENEGSVYALCARKAPVAQAFLHYLEKMTLGASSLEEDRTAWFMQARRAGKACLLDVMTDADEKNWAADLLLRYNILRSQHLLVAPAQDTFQLFTTLALHRKHPAFAALSGQVLDMYEAILDKGAPAQQQEAARQVVALFPAFSCTQGYPHIQSLELRCACQKLVSAWQSASYWQGLNALQEDMKRSRLPWNQLLTGEVQQAGRNRLIADLSPLSRFAEFANTYEQYKACPGFPPAADEASFGSLCMAQYKACFIARFDAQTACCVNLAELLHMQDFSERVLHTAKETDRTAGGMCIQAIKRAGQLLITLDDQAAVPATLGKAAEIEGFLSGASLTALSCYGRVIGLFNRYWLEEKRQELMQKPFPVRLAFGLVCSRTAGGSILWEGILSLLCPGYEDMMRSPFSTGSIDLFRTLRCMLAMLALHTESDGSRSLKWPASLSSFLNENAFADYTARVRREKKTLDVYLPDLMTAQGPEADALRMWLSV